MCTCLHMCRGHGRTPGILFCHYPPHSFKAGSFPDLGTCGFQVVWQSASLSDPLSLSALLSVGVTRLHGDHTRYVAAGILTLVLTLCRKGLCFLSQLFCPFKQCFGNRVLAGKGAYHHQAWQFTASDCPPSTVSQEARVTRVPHNSMYSLSERCMGNPGNQPSSSLPVLVSFLSTSHKLESCGKREVQPRDCLHPTELWAYLWAFS